MSRNFLSPIIINEFRKWPMTRYIAYAVDVFGIANATYELQCIDDEDAENRVRKLLDAHQTIELWEGVRRIARVTRDGWQSNRR
jgi:hypothetical protein